MMITKRPYYDCLIEAAYMAKNFGVTFQTKFDEGGQQFSVRYKRKIAVGEFGVLFDGVTPDCAEREAIKNANITAVFFPQFNIHPLKIHVHPDSLHIFEPQIGDFIETTLLNDEGGDMYHYHFPEIQLKNDKLVKILLRNGKPFINPKSK